MKDRWRSWSAARRLAAAQAKLESTELPRGAFHHSDNEQAYWPDKGWREKG